MTNTSNSAELRSDSQWLLGLAKSLIHDQSAADDLVQETWLSACNNSPNRAHPPRPWLSTVLRNAFRKQLRSTTRLKKRELWSEHQPSRPISPDDELARKEAKEMVGEALNSLNDAHRVAIRMYFFEELSAVEIARRIDAPASTVRSRIKYGLEKMRTHLDANQGARSKWHRALIPFIGVPHLKPISPMVQKGGMSKWAASLNIKMLSVVALCLLLAGFTYKKHLEKHGAHPRLNLGGSEMTQLNISEVSVRTPKSTYPITRKKTLSTNKRPKEIDQNVNPKRKANEDRPPHMKVSYFNAFTETQAMLLECVPHDLPHPFLASPTIELVDSDLLVTEVHFGKTENIPQETLNCLEQTFLSMTIEMPSHPVTHDFRPRHLIVLQENGQPRIKGSRRGPLKEPFRDLSEMNHVYNGLSECVNAEDEDTKTLNMELTFEGQKGALVHVLSFAPHDSPNVNECFSGVLLPELTSGAPFMIAIASDAVMHCEFALDERSYRCRRMGKTGTYAEISTSEYLDADLRAP